MAFRRILFVGYGSIGQALTPVLLQDFGYSAEQLHAVAADDEGLPIACLYGVDHTCLALTENNFTGVLESKLKAGDCLINVAVEVSSIALIAWCQQHGVHYLDTCVEPWKGGYNPGAAANVVATTNYYLREQALQLHRHGVTTAVIAHGANPGLVTHFVKAGLHAMAKERGFAEDIPWPQMAYSLGIKTIHIAERDSQVTSRDFVDDEFANTWSVDGFMAEAGQCAELGWGTHEDQIPDNGSGFESGERSAIYLTSTGAATVVRSWVPAMGQQDAYLIPHHEATSITEMLTVKGPDGEVAYRPTVYYAYAPCAAAEASLERWRGRGPEAAVKKVLLRDELVDGVDQLGVLFVFDGGAYWYGSTLSLREARSLAKHNNATSMQVVAGIMGALAWMERNPNAGVIEAETMDHEFIMEIARPFLGQVTGVWTNWQPQSAGNLCFDAFHVE